MPNQIKLQNKQIALVDDDDADRVKPFKWYACRGTKNKTWYARYSTSLKTGPPQKIYLHRFIANAQPGQIIEHLNGNGLDCQKANLRIRTRAHNTRGANGAPSEIRLTRGKIALVDDEDFERVNQYKWHTQKGSHNHTWYARRHAPQEPTRTMFLHRFILNAGDDEQVDHINGNGLDCRKSNMRLCTQAENNRNVKPRRKPRSGYRGVEIMERMTGESGGKMFRARIRFNRKAILLGTFSTALEAALEYDKAARELHGEFATTNF